MMTDAATPCPLEDYPHRTSTDIRQADLDRQGTFNDGRLVATTENTSVMVGGQTRRSTGLHNVAQCVESIMDGEDSEALHETGFPSYANDDLAGMMDRIGLLLLSE